MTTADHQRFMARAIELAQIGVRKDAGGPFGAVVVKDGQIIAEGHNEVTSTNDPTAHGEVVAIRRACRKLGSFQLDGCTIYTSCEPCPMCLGAIYWARPVAVYMACTHETAAEYGFDDQYIYDEIEKAPLERAIPMIQIMGEEGLAAFRAWQEKEDRVEY